MYEFLELGSQEVCRALFIAFGFMGFMLVILVSSKIVDSKNTLKG